MAEKSVSVIIPAFNRELYIEQCVRSALRQTYSAVEVIIVDDGSTDGTMAILESLASDPRVTVLTHPGRANKGQSASLNLGLRHAKGEYVNILDSDDFLDERKFEIEVPFMEAHLSVGLLYSNGHRTNAAGQPLWAVHREDHEESNDPNALLLDCYMHLPVNSLVRRSVYEKVGYFEEKFRAAQDHDMLLRLAESTEFAYLPDHLFFYRMHENSISGKNQDLRWRTGFEILRRARSRYPYRLSTVRKRLAVLNFRLAQVAWRSRRPIQAVPRLLAAGALDPVRAMLVVSRREVVK